MKDNIRHPSHYTTGNIEVIDYIKDKLTPEEFTGYCIGNVMKYISRWRHKGGTEDLKKATVYLEWAIKNLTEDVDYDIPDITDIGTESTIRCKGIEDAKNVLDKIFELMANNTESHVGVIRIEKIEDED